MVSIGPSGPGHITGSGGGVGVGFVAGAAALVRSYHPRLTADQVRHRMEATADHPGSALPDPALGFGVVDPYAAVARVLPEESGEKPLGEPAPPVRVPPVPIVDHTPEYIAVALAIVVVTAMVLGASTAAVIRRGRKRGWRSAWAASKPETPATD